MLWVNFFSLSQFLRGKLCHLWDGREKKNNGPCTWMMQFPYFSRDKGGVRLLESLLRDPQDVLRKKSEQSCTLALGAVEVHGREAFTSFTPLCRRPRGSPWNAGLPLPPGMPWPLCARPQVWNLQLSYSDWRGLNLLPWRMIGSAKGGMQKSATA